VYDSPWAGDTKDAGILLVRRSCTQSQQCPSISLLPAVVPNLVVHLQPRYNTCVLNKRATSDDQRTILRKS
ncbi:hypothetical protein CHS0354_022255, partial [Potamilus streckersoni]